jgi:hypothetical protein
MTKTLSLIISVFLFISTNTFSQVISPYVYGENAWMPKTIGTYSPSGNMDKLWGKVKDCGIKFIRVGGTSYDKNLATNAQFLALVDSIRKIGAEPLLEVPYNNGAFAETTAASIVQYLNITMGRNVKYWNIANEPNLYTSPSPTSTSIATYFKRFATAMKLVDPTIKIVGPGLASLSSNTALYSALIGGADDITGKDANGNYYLDVVDYHCYRGYAGAQTRTNVTTDAPAKFITDISSMTGWINTANTKNSRIGISKLTWAVTEFNVNYQNPTSNDATGVGSHGFLNGQYWAECLGYCMQNSAFAFAPWSVHEGGGGRGLTDLGFLDGANGTYPRSSYYHLQFMAKNNKTNFATSSDNQALVKIVSTKDATGTTVIILNEELSTSFTYTVRLDLNTITGSSALKINVDNSQAVQFSPTSQIPAQGTHFLVFDNLGNIQKILEYTLTDAQNQAAPRVISSGVVAAASETNADIDNFRIFSNQNEVNFDFSSLKIQSSFQLRIFNLSGQQIYSKALQPGISKHTIPRENLASGVYISSVQSKEKNVRKVFCLK